MCLSRQAQIRELPTQWGLPPALVVEQSCIAKGDPACGYLVRVYESRRWLPSAVGCVAGGAAAVAAHLALGSPGSSGWMLPLVGAAVGYILELKRSIGANQRTAQEINTAYLDMAKEDARSRRELFDMGERQQARMRVVERQMEELRTQVQSLRSSELDAAVQQLDTAMVDLAADSSAGQGVPLPTFHPLHSPDGSTGLRTICGRCLLFSPHGSAAPDTAWTTLRDSGWTLFSSSSTGPAIAICPKCSEALKDPAR
jgi:hypothetical protein